MPWTLRDLMSEATTTARLLPDDIHQSRVSFYVNLAQRDVANRVQQVEFERLAVSSTSSGDDKLFLPTDCERVLNLSFDTGSAAVGGRGLRQCNLWELDAKSDGTATGVPNKYLSYATWLELYPSPNSQYSLLLRYIARLSDITNLTSIPSVDTRYHQGVLFKTVEYLALRKGDPAMANAFRQRYEAELTDQPNALQQRGANRLGMSARLIVTEE
jgi:hypothetical protein